MISHEGTQPAQRGQGIDRSTKPRSTVAAALAVIAALLATTTAWLLPASPAGAADPPPALPAPTIGVAVAPGAVRLPATVTGTAHIRGTTALTGKFVFRLRKAVGDPVLDTSSAKYCTGNVVKSVEVDIEVVGSEAAATATLPFSFKSTDGGFWWWEAAYENGNDAYRPHKVCALLLAMGEDDTEPGQPAGTLVTEIYEDLLGRKPSAGELSQWSTAISSGASTAGDLVADLRGGEEHRTNVDPVVRLYRAYFLRVPDAGGLRFWIKERRGGRSLASISQSFSGSPEFVSRYGALDDAGFVDLVYTNILGRPGDQVGRAFWIDQLARRVRDRGNVMIGFSESPEYVKAQAAEVDVTVLFVMLLFRAPSAEEFRGLVDLLEIGPTAPLPFTVADLADDLLDRS